MSYRILGIDPGTAIVGFGVVDVDGGHSSSDFFGCIRTSSELTDAERLAEIYKDITALIEESSPDAVAIEQLFFQRNVTTAMTVSQARGVLLLAAQQAKIPIFEYTPLQIKQALTGYGRADKPQVQAMVVSVLGLNAVPQPDDTADALAVACCHAHSRSFYDSIV